MKHKNSNHDRRKKIVQKLKAALAARGLRQHDVALATGLSDACISRIVQGERRARASERARVENKLGYALARLLRRAPRRTRRANR